MCLGVDHAGDLYLTGTFDTLSDFDPGVPVYNLAPENGRAFYLQKLDHNGSLLWVKQWSGKSFMDQFKLSIGDANQVYLAWQFEDTLDADRPGEMPCVRERRIRLQGCRRYTLPCPWLHGRQKHRYRRHAEMLGRSAAVVGA